MHPSPEEALSMQCPACATVSGPVTWTCPACGQTTQLALLDQLRHHQFLVDWLERQPTPHALRDRARQALRLAQLALVRPGLPEELALARLALTQTYAWQEAGVVSAATAQRLENLLAQRTRALAAGWPAISA